jgi:hypothetical protein
MCLVWLENCPLWQDHWICSAELLEFNTDAPVVTGAWLFLLPPQCSKGFVDSVQKPRLGEGTVTGKPRSQLKLSHMPVFQLPRVCEHTPDPFSLEGKPLLLASQGIRVPSHRKSISMITSQNESNIHRTVLLVLIPFSTMTLNLGH